MSFVLSILNGMTIIALCSIAGVAVGCDPGYVIFGGLIGSVVTLLSMSMIAT